MGQESRRVEWEQRVAAWKSSGLTQKEVSARRNHLSILLAGGYTQSNGLR